MTSNMNDNRGRLDGLASIGWIALSLTVLLMLGGCDDEGKAVREQQVQAMTGQLNAAKDQLNQTQQRLSETQEQLGHKDRSIYGTVAAAAVGVLTALVLGAGMGSRTSRDWKQQRQRQDEECNA